MFENPTRRIGVLKNDLIREIDRVEYTIEAMKEDRGEVPYELILKELIRALNEIVASKDY